MLVCLGEGILSLECMEDGFEHKVLRFRAKP